MAAVSGAAGLKPRLAAVDRRPTVALANKECLVCAGDFFMEPRAKAGLHPARGLRTTSALFQARGSGKPRGTWSASCITASASIPDLGPAPTSSRTTLAQAAQSIRTGAWETEDHHRFGIDDEQGARGHRSRLSVRADAG